MAAHDPGSYHPHTEPAKLPEPVSRSKTYYQTSPGARTLDPMSSLTKLKLMLAMMASKVQPRKRRVDFGAPSPHSQRWDERERTESARAQQIGYSGRAFNMRVLALIGVMFAVSLLADLFLSRIMGTAVGLVLLGGALAYMLYVRQKRSSYRMM